jgi:predicted nucleotidyltransferase
VIALTPFEIAEVRAVLAAHLPAGISVGVFGSRAGGQPKPWSDLDLVLEGDSPLPLALLARLAEAFDEAKLAWKVDLVDRRAVSEAFGRIIDASRVDLAQD